MTREEIAQLASACSLQVHLTNEARKKSQIQKQLDQLFTPGSNDLIKQARRDIKQTLLSLLEEYPLDRAYSLAHTFKYSCETQAANDREKPEIRQGYAAKAEAWKELIKVFDLTGGNSV